MILEIMETPITPNLFVSTEINYTHPQVVYGNTKKSVIYQILKRMMMS